jgi:hypothetical protein
VFAIEAQLAAGVGLVSDSGNHLPLKHRYRLMIPDDRDIEYAFEEPGLIPKVLVHGWHRYPRRFRDRSDCRSGVSPAQERHSGGVQDRTARELGLFLSAS